MIFHCAWRATQSETSSCNESTLVDWGSYTPQDTQVCIQLWGHPYIYYLLCYKAWDSPESIQDSVCLCECLCVVILLSFTPSRHDFTWRPVFIGIVCLNVKGLCSYPHHIPFIPLKLMKKTNTIRRIYNITIYPLYCLTIVYIVFTQI